MLPASIRYWDIFPYLFLPAFNCMHIFIYLPMCVQLIPGHKTHTLLLLSFMTLFADLSFPLFLFELILLLFFIFFLSGILHDVYSNQPWNILNYYKERWLLTISFIFGKSEDKHWHCIPSIMFKILLRYPQSTRYLNRTVIVPEAGVL